MANGTIKFFNANKGFGFVTPDGGGADIFLPAASLAGSGITKIQPGQRVTFEQGPDKKGPKVIALQLVGEPIVRAPSAAPQRVMVYCDPSSDTVADILQFIRDGGYQMQLIDCTTAPPSPDQLRHLSHLLGGSGTSLVRRHDPLFFALQLDDRFIGDQEFWTAITEHPTLINGPVLVLSGKARVCKSLDDAKVFLTNGGNIVAPKPKTLSPRVAALIRGEMPVAPKRSSDAAIAAIEPVPRVEGAIAPAQSERKGPEGKVKVEGTAKPPILRPRATSDAPVQPTKKKSKPAAKTRAPSVKKSTATKRAPSPRKASKKK